MNDLKKADFLHRPHSIGSGLFLKGCSSAEPFYA